MHSHSRSVLVLAVLASAVAPAAAQMQPPSQLRQPPGLPGLCLPCLPGQQSPYKAAPLLYVKFIAPEGTKLTFYRGARQGQTYEAPCVIGFRPGYIFRMKVFDVPGLPGLTFAPSLDVLATLLNGPNLRAHDFPCALTLTMEDFRSAYDGALVTKIVVLEHQQDALPQTTTADRPMQYDAGADRDPLAAAQERGTPLLVLRMGPKEYTEEEFLRTGMQGTVMLPGEKAIGEPRVPPIFYPRCAPQLSSDLMCLINGGDGKRATVWTGEEMRGLEPADAVAAYQDSKGTKRFAVSNRVCLCVPRFLLVRSERVPAALASRRSLNNTVATQIKNILQQETTTFAMQQQEQLSALASNLRLSSNVRTIGTVVLAKSNGLELVASTRTLRDLTGICKKPEEKDKEKEKDDEDCRLEGPLVIIKWPDRLCVLIGDVVTFFLRYTNTGRRPVDEIVVLDNLGPRFEYVPGSARSDRNGLFTTLVNEAGSQVLRWEIEGDLAPGQSGVVSFQAKIR